MKIVFMGTPEFAVPALKTLIVSRHKVAAVYSQPPQPAGRGMGLKKSPVQLAAEERNISVFTPKTLRDITEQQRFGSLGADIAVVAAYGLILPKEVLKAYRLGCINIHPSLLPRWRGAAPIQRMLMAGDTETGVCIMQMDEGLDTGDILLQEKVKVMEDENFGTLHERLAAKGAELLLQALEAIEKGKITKTKQAKEGVTYAKKIEKSECQIDWSVSAEEIRHKIRALAPKPGAYFGYKGENIKLLDAGIVMLKTPATPGQVIGSNVIACGKNALELKQLQRPGKKALSAMEFLKGFAIPVGTILPSPASGRGVG